MRIQKMQRDHVQKGLGSPRHVSAATGVVASLAMLLSACGGDDGADDTVTLQMWDWWGEADPINPVVENLVDRYTEENPHVEIVRRSIPYGDYSDAVIQGALADELPDILISDVVDTIAWGGLGVFYDMSEEVEEWGQRDLYQEERFSAVLGPGGEVFSLPNSSNTLGLYYDVDVLEEHNIEPPASWDELYAASETISENGDYAIIMAADPSLTGYQWLPWLWQAGGEVGDVAGPPGVEALTVWKDLIDMGAMTPDVVGYGHDDLREQFASGQVAMMINGPWNLEALRDDGVDVNWEVTPLPCEAECASQAGGENIGIGAGTDQPDEAWAFIEWLHSDDIVTEWTIDHHSVPHRSDVDEAAVLEEDPQMAAFLEQGNYMRPPPAEYIEVWPEVQEALSDAIHGALVGGETPEDALERAADEIDGLQGQ